MTTYVISYELSQGGQDRGALFAAIKALADTSCHCLGSTWLVKTRMNAFEIAASLRGTLHENDGLLVVNAGSDAAWTGLVDDCDHWLETQV